MRNSLSKNSQPAFVVISLLALLPARLCLTLLIMAGIFMLLASC
jgi:hypothetical protein